MVKFFVWCFLILPWVIIPNARLSDWSRLPKETFFDFICLGIICFSFFSGLKKRYFNKYLSWLALWVFIVCGINWYLPMTLSFGNQRAVNLWTLEAMIHTFLALWTSYIILSYFEESDYLYIKKFIKCSALLICSVALLQKFGLDIYGKIAIYNNTNKFGAFLDNPNIVANYLALSVPFFLKKDIKHIIGLLLICFGLSQSSSEWSMLVAGVGVFIYALLWFRGNRAVLWSLIGGAGLAGAFAGLNIEYLLSHFGSHRVELWVVAWDKFKQNPIFGQGLGVVKSWDLHIPGISSVWYSVHNDWFEILIQLGVLGAVLFGIVVVAAIKKFNYKNVQGYDYFVSFLSFLVLMFAAFPMEVAPLALFGLLDWWGVETL